MYDAELVIHILGQIQKTVETIRNRFEPVESVNYFTDTSAGMEKFDSICMLLIAIGESLKNLDKVTNGELLQGYPQIDWKKAKGLRDIISHQYFDVNAEAIYDVCEEKIPELGKVIEKIMADLAKNEHTNKNCL